MNEAIIDTLEILQSHINERIAVLSMERESKATTFFKKIALKELKLSLELKNIFCEAIVAKFEKELSSDE